MGGGVLHNQGLVRTRVAWSLTTLLRSIFPAVQCTAAEVLGVIAAQDAFFQVEAMRAGALTTLVAMLRAELPALQEAGCSAIQSFAAGGFGQGNWERLNAAISPLVALLAKPHTRPVRLKASLALAS